MKICNKCGIEKPLSEYHWNNKKNIPYSQCKACKNSQRRKYRHGDTKEGALKLRLQQARHRSSSTGKLFDLTLQDLLDLWDNQDGCCALTGTPMEYVTQAIDPKRKLHTNSVSLDRIDSYKGYVKGNIQLVIAKANLAKGPMTSEEFLSFCNAVVRKNNDKETKR